MWFLEREFWWIRAEIRCDSKSYFECAKLDIRFQASNYQQLLEEIVQIGACGSELIALFSLNEGAGAQCTRCIVHNLMGKRSVGHSFNSQLAFIRGGIESDKMPGARASFCFGGYFYDNTHVYVADKMEDYDADKVAQTLSATVIENLVTGLDRAELLELINVEPDWQMVGDVKGIHPPSLEAPQTLKIHSKACPFLEAGTSAECCAGSIISRSGHATVSMPCYRTDLQADNAVCAHCEQLWAARDEEGFYILDPKTMDKAAEFYKPGKSGVMKKWQEIVGASAIFDDEVQAVKDVFADSEDELDAEFPGMNFDEYCKEIMNKSGVTFADAGRSRNPYRRTWEQQTRLGMYAQHMSVLWVRVKASVSAAIFNKFMRELRELALTIEQAARWTLQRAFSGFPVFVGPLVCADIMVAGFRYAEARYDHQIGRVMQDTQEPRNEEDISVGPVLSQLAAWAKSVAPIKRASPVKSKAFKMGAAPAAAGAENPMWNAASTKPEEVAKDLNADFAAAPADSSVEEKAIETPAKSKSGKKQLFYAVARGFKPGIYTSWEEANTQVKNYSGFKVKKFKTMTEAEQFVQEAQANPDKIWYVLKNSRRDGAYESKAMATFWRGFGSTMVKRTSLTAAKRFLGKSRIRIYRNDWEESGKQDPAKAEGAHGAAAAASSTHASAASAAAEVQTQFFACKGGSEDGVYKSLNEVLTAVKKGGGTFEVFDTEAAAAEYCRPEDTKASADIASDMYVVWSGKSTGVMSASECVAATAGVHGAEADGPMSEVEAKALWIKKKETSQTASQTHELQHVEYPTDGEWAEVVKTKQSRVFACWIAKGKGRIAFTWEAAAKGVRKNLSVEVFSSEDTLFLNFARAEEFLATSTSEPSIQEKIAAARKSISKNSSTRQTASAAPARSKSRPAASKASRSGQSVGARVGMSGVVHTREVTQLRRCFIDAATAIEIRGAPEEPEEDELERDMPAPGAATYLSDDVAEHADGKGDLTLLEYFSYKKGKVKAWPIKDYDEFLSFCRQGQRLCAASSKDTGIANAPVFSELIDIAVKVHWQMSKRGTLGPNEIRFKIRMYLHLQYATNNKVLHTGAGAMRAFEAAVDTFGMANVPKFRQLMRNSGKGSPYVPAKRGEGGKSPKKTPPAQPSSGCWRCAASDHYASDKKFHPVSADESPPLTAEEKKGIMDRIKSSSLSASEKESERTRVLKYWSQHSL